MLPEQSIHDLRLAEGGIVGIVSLDVGGYGCGEPASALHHRGLPAELADGFNDTPGEEYGALVVVGERQGGEVALVEVVVVVDEIDLQARGLERGHLYDEGVVGVVDYDVETRQTYHLVELVTTFVDGCVLGHERTHFGAVLLGAFGERFGVYAQRRARQIRVDFLRDIKYFFNVHSRKL